MTLTSKLYPFTIDPGNFGNGKATIVVDDQKPVFLKSIQISANAVFQVKISADQKVYYQGSGQNILSFYDEVLSGISGEPAPLNEVFAGGTALEVEIFNAGGLDPYEGLIHVYEVV